MKKYLKNKNLWIVATMLTIALIMLAIGLGNRNATAIDNTALAEIPVMDAGSFSMDSLMDYKPAQKSSFLQIIPSAMAEEAEESLAYTREELEEIYNANGYVLIYFANWGKTGIVALPAEGEEEAVLPLQQPIFNEDGEYLMNELHLTHNSMHIASANCDTQDCVDQGTVTLENKESRILGNMIICSPHSLLLELYTADELIDNILYE